MNMKRRKNLYRKIYSLENLNTAFKRARLGKIKKSYVQKFEQNLEENLLKLQMELRTKTYKPKPLQTFVIRDPKTRKISKSDFRDRVIHHAICNILEPIFDKAFIHDSYANRKGKGNLKAVQQFNCFMHKVSNKTAGGYCLKADIKHYFQEVDHKILFKIIKKKVKDKRVVLLIKGILENGGGAKHLK